MKLEDAGGGGDCLFFAVLRAANLRLGVQQLRNLVANKLEQHRGQIRVMFEPAINLLQEGGINRDAINDLPPGYLQDEAEYLAEFLADFNNRIHLEEQREELEQMPFVERLERVSLSDTSGSSDATSPPSSEKKEISLPGDAEPQDLNITLSEQVISDNDEGTLLLDALRLLATGSLGLYSITR